MVFCGWVGGGRLLNHSLRGFSEGLSTAPWHLGSEACFKGWAVFDRGDLFSVGLYMVIWLFSAWLMGPVQCDRSQQKKTKRGVWREERMWARIWGPEKPRSISNQDNCHIPGAWLKLPLFGSAVTYQIEGQLKSPLWLKDLLSLNLIFLSKKTNKQKLHFKLFNTSTNILSRKLLMTQKSQSEWGHLDL